MRRILAPLLIIMAIASMLGTLGCGTSATNPAMPSTTYLAQADGMTETEDRSVLGEYEVFFNPETNALECAESREGDAHYDITAVVRPHTNVTLVSYNPATQQLIFDFSITNPTIQTVYDVRSLFLAAPGTGYSLLNPDDYTALFNPYGTGVVNPFRAYAKTVVGRQFAPAAIHTERFHVQLPIAGTPPFNFTLLVECSHPGNCQDVYEISNQSVSNAIIGNGSATITLDAYDHQNNIGQIYVDTTPITGGFTWLTNTGLNTWTGNLSNTAGASLGTYNCLIVADSYASADNLYDYVSIKIAAAPVPPPVPPPPPPPPVTPPTPPVPPPPPPPPPPPNPPVPPVPPPVNPPNPPLPPQNPPQPPVQPPVPPPLPPPVAPPQPPIPPPPPPPPPPGG